MALKQEIHSVKTGREDQLQFLRFLAFFHVFLYHAESWVFFPYSVSHSASAAVSFFFVLSGLATGYSWYGREISCSLKDTGNYLWKKLRKLYPLYFCTTLFAVMMSNLPEMITAQDLAGIQGYLRQLLGSLLLVQSWFQDGYFQFNGVGWFLSSMLFLYVLTLPAMFVLNKMAKSKWRYLLLPMVFGGMLFTTAVYCYLTQSLNREYWHYIFPPARMGEYFGGMALGMLLQIVKPYIKTGNLSRILFTVLEIGVLLYWVRSLSSPGNYWRNYTVSWLIPNVAVLSVFTVGAGWISDLFRLKPLKRLGDVSFECYLIHQILIGLYAANNPVPADSQLAKITAFVFCLALSVLFALLLNRSGNSKR